MAHVFVVVLIKMSPRLRSKGVNPAIYHSSRNNTINAHRQDKVKNKYYYYNDGLPRSRKSNNHLQRRLQRGVISAP